VLPPVVDRGTGPGVGSGSREGTQRMQVEIDSVEDRSGTNFTPESFGFVYFTDGSRVGYSHAEDHLPVWQPYTNGGGKYQEVTVAHLLKAFKMLQDAGVFTADDARRMRRELTSV
jgi:hypothetical protein